MTFCLLVSLSTLTAISGLSWVGSWLDINADVPSAREASISSGRDDETLLNVLCASYERATHELLCSCGIDSGVFGSWCTRDAGEKFEGNS